MTVAAAALACAAFLEGYPSPIYDAHGYWVLSGVLRAHGLSAWPVDFRTYGYPLFAAAVTGFRDASPEAMRLGAFLAQLVIHLAACALVARRLAAILRSPRAGLLAYAVGALNPALLVHTTELLSDLLSAVLIQLAVAFSWRLPGPPPPSARLRPAGQAFLAFLCAGLATVVRPGNAPVAVALALVWAVRTVRWRERFWPSAAAALAGLIPPLVPQMILNYGLSGRLNPLLVGSLYREQRVWGMATLKYGTVVIPGLSPFLTYVNPLYAGDPGPRAFLSHHPLRYLATLAIHAFGLLDQDLPFTYITDFTPWYRWPLQTLSWLLVAVAAIGGIVEGARLVRRRSLDESGLVLVAAVLVGGAYAVVYLPVAVEARFGLPLFALMTPLLVWGLTWLGSLGVPRRARMRAAAVALLCVAGCAGLSAWLASTRTNVLVASPANALVVNPKPALGPTPPGHAPDR